MRVTNYVVEIVPRVTGRVIEVPVEGNRLIKKGDVLLRTPSRSNSGCGTWSWNGSGARQTSQELERDLQLAQNNTAAPRRHPCTSRAAAATVDRARRQGAGTNTTSRAFAPRSSAMKPPCFAAKQAEEKVRLQIGATYAAITRSVAAIKAQLDTARWNLAQTVIRAPADGYAINLQVRPGSWRGRAAASAGDEFRRDQQQVIAFFDQNQLTKVAAGNEVEVSLKVQAGADPEGRVNSIIWATAQGQFNASGTLPTTAAELEHGAPPLAVRGEDRHGSPGKTQPRDGRAVTRRSIPSIWTPLHMVRKVIVRVTSNFNYLVFKLE